MNRRLFLRDTTLGALALGLPLGAFARRHNPPGEMTGVPALARACGAREWPGPAFHLAAPGLKRDLARFVRERFDTERFSVFSFRGGELIFLALEKRLGQTVLTECAMPCWGRGGDGRYRHLATLNGFQVEALLRAAGRLGEQGLDPIALGRLLLPAGPVDGTAGFTTRRGRVNLKTRVEADAVNTHIEVYADNDALYQERFAAAHLAV